MDGMPRLTHRLSAIGLRSLPPGKHLDGAGLYLMKPDLDGGRWALRYRLHGRRRDMGLGGWPAIGLAEADEVQKPPDNRSAEERILSPFANCNGARILSCSRTSPRTASKLGKASYAARE
jgi:hypothetical protein